MNNKSGCQVKVVSLLNRQFRVPSCLCRICCTVRQDLYCAVLKKELSIFRNGVTLLMNALTHGIPIFASELTAPF
jgi:hypothetical protein